MALTAHITEKRFIIRISWTFKQFHLYVFREVFDNISADDICDFSTKCQNKLAVVKRNRVWDNLICSMGVTAKETISHSLRLRQQVTKWSYTAINVICEQAEFNNSFCRQIRVPFFPAASNCCKCGSGQLETFNDHAPICHTSAYLVTQHSNVSNLIFRMAKLRHVKLS